MPRPRRGWVDHACYHITHRCHERKFLLKFAKHRDQYLDLLQETNKRFKVDILNKYNLGSDPKNKALPIYRFCFTDIEILKTVSYACFSISNIKFKIILIEENLLRYREKMITT